jgi:DNA-binding CsgD family transcriptional regulator
LDEAQRGVLPQLTIDASYWLASVLELEGRIGEAVDVVSEAVELAERTGDEALGRHRIGRLQLKLGFHRGDWRSALAGLREYGEESSTHARIGLYQEGATWLALVDGAAFAAESLSWLADARACARKAACPRCSTELRLAAAEVLARTGRAADAAASLADWRDVQRRPQPRDLIVERWVEGLVAAARGQSSAAATLDATAARAKDGGFGLDALWAEIDAGRVLRRDDRDAAITRLRGAADAAATSGALTEQQVAEKLLRSLGVRTWRRQHEGSELLTAREQQIVGLISAGASNPEIAQQLFLSRKTVERHVSNVFKKVGVRNRAELAAKAEGLGFKGEGAPR